MRSLVREHRTVAEGMLSVFASRLRGLTALVADLTHLDVTGWVAKVLLTYEVASGKRELALGHQDLASMVGSTREVVSRSLRRLEEQGSIVRKSRSLEIVDRNMLAAAMEDQPR